MEPNQFAGQPAPQQPPQQSTSFPGHRYHPSGASRLFLTAEDFEAAGPGWRDVPYPASPAAELTAAELAPAAPKPACETCKKLVSENVNMKLRFDKAYAALGQEHEALKGQHDLVASQNVVLTQQLAQLQGKVHSFEAALNQPPQPPPPQPQENTAAAVGAEAPPTPAAPATAAQKPNKK